MTTNNNDLTFRTFGALNELRAMEWHKGGLDTWSPAEWTNALAGEVGELCNVTKKILRHDLGIQQRAVSELTSDDHGLRAQLVRMAADEIADCQAYLDLCAQRLDLDLQSCTVRKFNEISDRENLPYKFEGRFLLPSNA